ncbi:hypothetical protein B484DRAFT_455636 [Ochromonadaceae sp. CCMP2298]|nr:hypothetical protein B484DRAFT_455636 [Ochromonadaceae sp. CCMP2298]
MADGPLAVVRLGRGVNGMRGGWEIMMWGNYLLGSAGVSVQKSGDLHVGQPQRRGRGHPAAEP